MHETVNEVTSPRMLTLREAAEALRMSHYTLREPAWLTRLAAIKVGSKWLVPAERVTEVLSGGIQQ